MLVQGSAQSGRTKFLTNMYISLLEKGINAGEILVLVQNSYKKDLFLNEIKSNIKINHFENPQIYTFYGLCYNTIKNCWPLIENILDDNNTTISPNLTGLEISQFFFRQAIKDAGFKDYNSKINLIHQLFRRYSLIVNNNLSEKDVSMRSNILKEVFDEDAKTAINIFKKKTVEYRAFDYIRQVSIFNYIYQNTDYFKDIKYLIVDDADEITTAEFDFIKYIKNRGKNVIVGYDRYGSSRLGFLNTDIKATKNIEELLKNEEKKEFDEIKSITLPKDTFSYTRRIEMLDKAFEKISELVESGANPSDIVLITPIIDSALKFEVSEKLSPKEINCCFLSGSEKLCENKTVKNTLTLLKLSLDENIEIYTIRHVLNEMLGIPLKNCIEIIEKYKSENNFLYIDLKNEFYNKQLKNLVETMKLLKNPELLLSEKIYLIYEKIILSRKENIKDLEKVNFFCKQIDDFETVFEKFKYDTIFQKNVLTQIENSIISENPSLAPDIPEDSVIISTAQKIIDFSIKSKYQIFLDISSQEWIKDDFGTLYNAWVFQKSWNKKEFTYEDNIKLSELKTKKMLRKLSILAEESFAYSSLFDSRGNENFGGIEKHFIKSKAQEKSQKFDFQFVPRNDQKPILEYKSGKMGISAVPGAGKTTVLLAFIIKLLEKEVDSEKIYVLTYMDSAARNFKQRIKQACPNLEKLPNISTIHGLALRILKENSNFVQVGLDENFEVCDDVQRQKIIREIISKMQLNQDDFDKYQNAVSYLKLADCEKIAFSKDFEIRKFLKFYNIYNTYLKSKNIIDYDDMLLYCVKLLEKNPQTAEYYQNMCEYIIEDEAQDSSSIQQKLLTILSKKHKNLIRCGDLNQAITATFANTDIEGFRDFIKNSKNVMMNHSQRCAKDIYNLANRLVDFSKTEEIYKNAFFEIEMKEVKGKNPENKNSLESAIFEDYKQEKSFIVENIRKIFSKDKDATIAILVRNNYNIDDYTSFLSQYGYNIATRSDVLKRQPVFALIFALIKFCSHPWQNENVINTAKILYEQKILQFKEQDFEYLRSLKTPFINQNRDEMPSSELSKLLWDLNYWLENSSLNLEEFTLKAGNYYYVSEIEKSNVYITSLLLKTFESQYPQREQLLEKLEESSQRAIGSKFNFFSTENNENSKGTVKIMTLHKSKGDEFDYVFIPELNEKTLPVETEEIKIKSKERFLESIKALNSKYRKKDENQQKIFQIEENLRLLYVGITRAKKKLFITSAKKYKKYSKIINTKPSKLFQDIMTVSGVQNYE